ncbi:MULTISPECIES: GNAT family N-acetyltransferase [unclassified Polaribacter]|uniref:GNAT family N-acetyltransferase n=1 Tax=unclassified Polaribacter TaxID=196858 RepID=UPI0011BF5647|nr:MULTISPECIES: GNAT family N-acetyltransferase [unclassified Polaribacter]TXD50864.1 GNAT family N-acetyltransferase [Polaribacter sp. IC063]TXD57689.1 GNAT family N-acetyltransferase [Polaribacter sp. IC066]
MIIKTFDAFNRMSYLVIDRITNFLHLHLEDCKDHKNAIRQSLLYAAKEIPSLGGYTFITKEKDIIVGALVMNKTGMKEYQSENLLVYLAVHKEYRKNGIASKLLKEAIEYCNGNITLQIDKENEDAIKVFEKSGFTSKKIQMTFRKA